MCDALRMENELRLSPSALQTLLVRRLRAELAASFFENVIPFRRGTPGPDGKRQEGIIAACPSCQSRMTSAQPRDRAYLDAGKECRMVGA
jgi:hypothetical protein